MNTATRTVGARVLSGSSFSISELIVEKFWSVMIVAALLISALSIIYVKDLTRRMTIQAQTIQQENAQAKVQWSKLILERSTLASQGRMQRFATRLHMEVPNKKNTVNVRS